MRSAVTVSVGLLSLGMLLAASAAAPAAGAETQAAERSDPVARPRVHGTVPLDLHQPEPADLSTPELIDRALREREIDPDTAILYLAFGLGDYGNLPHRFRSNVPWDGTLLLRRLYAALGQMRAGPVKSKIQTLVSASCGLSGSTLPSDYDSQYFHIEHDVVAGGLDIEAYALSLDTAWTVEISNFGWAGPPVLSSNPPSGNRYHVRIDDLGGGLYGYVSSTGDHAGFVGDNPNTAWDEGDAFASCMVLNRDYSAFPGTPQQALDATTAHELNHSIQYGYGALNGSNLPDASFIEGSATWMEDEVFDESDDNYNYLWPEFEMCMGQYTSSPYSYWVVFRGLTERFGTGLAEGGERVMQGFWEMISQDAAGSLTALDSALSSVGTNLAEAYHAFGAAAAFTKSCQGGYMAPYCFDEASGYVAAAGPTVAQGAINAIGDSYAGSLADHYALNWIRMPVSGGSYSITLHNQSGVGSLRASAVCDAGTGLKVYPFPATVGAGEGVTLPGLDPVGCVDVFAVLTNESQTFDNPDACQASSYLIETGLMPFALYLPLVAR